MKWIDFKLSIFQQQKQQQTKNKKQQTNNKPKSNKKVSNFETVSVVNKETVSQN